jgi:hypothetical protein
VVILGKAVVQDLTLSLKPADNREEVDEVNAILPGERCQIVADLIVPDPGRLPINQLM